MVYQKDVFLCHASEDKSAVIRPLAIALDAVGISYWLDEAEIHWGDSITGKVNEGLRQSRFVVVVMSEAFVAKHWPQREFNAVLNEEASTGEVRVLPLIVGSRTERRHIMSEYPLLNDKLYLEWDGGADKVVQALKGKLGMQQVFLMTPRRRKSEAVWGILRHSLCHICGGSTLNEIRTYSCDQHTVRSANTSRMHSLIFSSRSQESR